MKICFHCGKITKVYRKKLCNNCYRKKYQGADCLDCGKRIYGVSKRCFKCSRTALKGIPNNKNRGKNNGMFRGGRNKTSTGYIDILVDADKYKREHRLVMERFLGRELGRDEVVHHMNGDITDNRIENLKLFANSKEHSQYHWDNKWQNRRLKLQQAG
jgi:hypothetical protein